MKETAIMRQRTSRFLRLGLVALLLTMALALGACDTEEGGISDREGAGMAENAGQGSENEDGAGELEDDGDE
jgi:hypothetical protein